MLENAEQVYVLPAPDGEAVTYPVEQPPPALLSLSHTRVEQRLYEEMLAQTRSGNVSAGDFSIRRLMALTGIHNHSTVRRGRDGLLSKLSIGRQEPETGREPAHEGRSASGVLYRVFTPEEIIERRKAAGLYICPEPQPTRPNPFNSRPFGESARQRRAIERASDKYRLSHRQAQVAAGCAQGMTNREIARHLSIDTETVKFHLKHVFLKFGVRRRTELVARLLMPERVEEEEKG